MNPLALLVLVAGCRDSGVLVVAETCPEPPQVEDPHWDPGSEACLEDAGRPTCAPPNQREPTARGTVPCRRDSECDFYDEFCAAGYCRSVSAEEVTFCFDAAYLSGVPSVGEGPPDMRLFYTVAGQTESFIGAAPAIPDRCLAGWNACFEVPASLAFDGIAVAEVFIEDPTTRESTIVQSFDHPLDSSHVNRGCIRMGTSTYDYHPYESDVAAWFSVWYP